jgi:hypothetical protein
VHWHTTDYHKDRDAERRRGTLINRGFWLNRVPRLMLACRLAGHKPVVDGVDYGGRDRSRWVVCDRCGVRPDPQGDLDPEIWNIGDAYTGRWDGPLPTNPKSRRDAYEVLKGRRYAPGAWPAVPTGTVGGQLIIGKSFGGFGFQLKVGNAGSEHTLAAHAQINPIGALYLHTENFGQGLQRWLNPTGYESRVTGISAHDGRLHWTVWAKRNESSVDDPKWQRGSVLIDPRDILLGPQRYSYEDVGEPVTAQLQMPHGDDYEVELQLQRQRFGRRRGRQRESWTVDWRCRDGIPTKPTDRGRVYGSAVKASDAAVRQGCWPYEAVVGIAAQMMRDRVRYRYVPPIVEDWIEP